MNPQPNDLYTRIKNRLLSSFSVSPESRLRQLLKGEVISDGKPSLLLNRLRNLNDGNCSDEIIKTIFLDQLPAKLHGILALSNVDGLQALAQLADKVLDAMVPNEFNVSATTLAPDPCQLSISAIASTANLADMIETLNRKLDKLSREVNRTSRSLSRDRANSRSNSRLYSRNVRQIRKIGTYVSTIGNMGRRQKSAVNRAHGHLRTRKTSAACARGDRRIRR